MNVKQVLDITHGFTKVYLQQINKNDLFTLQDFYPDDISKVYKLKVIRIIPEDYLKLRIVVNKL